MKSNPKSQGLQAHHPSSSSTSFLSSFHYPKQHVLPKPRKPISSCPLLCAFYAEFDNIVGPMICYQSPPKFMDSDINLSTDEIDSLLESFFYNDNCNNNNTMSHSDEITNNMNTDNDRSNNNDDGHSDNNDKDVAGKTPSLHDTSQSLTSASASTQYFRQDQLQQEESSYSIFDSTSEYIITGHEMLTGQIISLSTHNMHILSFPVIIQSTQYERNSLLFSVGFVIRRLFDPVPFRPILSKLATTFQSMEIESAYLSNEQTRSHIQLILDGVIRSLNSPASECHLLLNDANILHLQYFPPPQTQGPVVPDYVVPVLLRPDSQLQSLDWDLTINWIVPHIDGKKFVKLIAESSQVDPEVVRACLRVLRHHNAVACVDIFQYDNIYVCTDKAQRMLVGDSDLKGLLEAAYNFVLKQSPLTNNNSSTVNSTTKGHRRVSNSGSRSFNNNMPIQMKSSGSYRHSPQVPSAGYSNENLSNSPSPSVDSVNTPTTPTFIHPPLSTSYNTTTSQQFNHTTLRTHPRSMMKALSILYVSCQRNLTIGDVWIRKLVSNTDSNGQSSRKNSNNEDSIDQQDDSRIDWKEVFENFDHIRFITFGIIHGLIRRLHEFPLALENLDNDDKDIVSHCTVGDGESDDGSFSLTDHIDKQYSPSYRHQQNKFPPLQPKRPTSKSRRDLRGISEYELAHKVASIMDGQHCDDEISCMFQRPVSDLKDLVRSKAKKQIVSIYQ